MLTDAERQTLLEIARAALAARVKGESYAPPPVTGRLAEPAGAFVSVYHRGELRGCIGHIEPTAPLAEVVARCAGAAATEDPRFPPVAPEELGEVALEISVLGPIERVERVEEIEVGRHGLLVEDGWRRGVLLPQVATEWGWDRETFLDHTCLKAGLPADAWRRGAQLSRFEAEVFGDADAPGSPSA